MRYKIKSYSVSVATDSLSITFPVPTEVYSALNADSESGYLDATSKRTILEAIRLIADDTLGGYVLCSTGQKVQGNLQNRCLLLRNSLSNTV